MSAWQGFVGEVRKLPAFARRDLMIKLSYRTALLGDAASLLLQSVLFWFVGKLVDPDRVPSVGEQENPYLAFVVVGIALAAFMGLALGRLVNAVEREHLIGTLESLLVTPTSFSTLQLGSVAYDLVYVPLRTGVFIALVSVLYGVDLTLSGLPAALLVLLVFIPFVWGIGVVLGAAVLTFRRGANLTGFVATGLALLSGAYFPVELLPDWLEPLVAVNPMALAMTDMRAALLEGAGVADVLDSVLATAVAAVVTLTAGSLLFRAAVARERRQGTLGMY